MLISIKCEDCGATDPEGFSRHYITEEVQRVVESEWKTKESFEYTGGTKTETHCNTCGRANVTEEHTSRIHQVTEYISNVLSGTIEPNDTLQLLDDYPEAGIIVLATPRIESFTLNITQDKIIPEESNPEQ